MISPDVDFAALKRDGVSIREIVSGPTYLIVVSAGPSGAGTYVLERRYGERLTVSFTARTENRSGPASATAGGPSLDLLEGSPGPIPTPTPYQPNGSYGGGSGLDIGGGYGGATSGKLAGGGLNSPDYGPGVALPGVAPKAEISTPWPAHTKSPSTSWPAQTPSPGSTSWPWPALTPPPDPTPPWQTSTAAPWSTPVAVATTRPTPPSYPTTGSGGASSSGGSGAGSGSAGAGGGGATSPGSGGALSSPTPFGHPSATPSYPGIAIPIQ